MRGRGSRTHDGTRLVREGAGDETPEVSELVVGGTALADDLAVPAGVVVLYTVSEGRILGTRYAYQVNDNKDIRARVKGSLNSLIVAREEGLVDGTTQSGGHQLPGCARCQQ